MSDVPAPIQGTPEEGWQTLYAGGPVWSLATYESKKDVLLAAACADGVVRLWDLQNSSERPNSELRGHEGAVLAVVADTVDGQTRLASAGIDGTVRLWNPEADDPLIDTLRGHVGGVRAVALGQANSSTILASAGADGTVRLWDPDRGIPTVGPISAHSGSALTVAFGYTGGHSILASGGDDATIRIWDPGSGKALFAPEKSHGGSVRSLAFGDVANRVLLASSSDDGTVRIWDPAIGALLFKPFVGHTGTVRDVAFTSVDGMAVLASAGIDGTIRFWNPATGLAYPGEVEAAESDLRGIAFTETGGRMMMAAATGDGVELSPLDVQYDPIEFSASTVDRSAVITVDDKGAGDEFNRLVTARHIHGVIGQLMSHADRDRPRNVVLSVDGRWGTGKSTLARILISEMKTRQSDQWRDGAGNDGALPHDPIVIEFDAWRESAVAPHWWALASAINRGVRKERSLAVRIAMTLSGAVGRILSSPASVSALVLTVVAVGALMWIRKSAPSQIDETLGTLQTFLTGATALVAAVAVATRSLFWSSPVLGRINIRSDDNPLGEVARMVMRIRRWSPQQGRQRRPILLVIDDLDRCEAPTVVAYLETVHTLLRDHGETSVRKWRSPPAPLIVLVLADGRWVRTAFTTQYGDFDELGSPVRSLGGDFLQKLFDHSVLVPDLTADQVSHFLRHITGRAEHCHGGSGGRRSDGNPQERRTSAHPPCASTTRKSEVDPPDR